MNAKKTDCTAKVERKKTESEIGLSLNNQFRFLNFIYLVFALAVQRLRAGYDFDNFASDGGLAHAVHIQREGVYDFACVF